MTTRASEARATTDEIEVQIRGLMLDPVTNMPIVVLKHVASELVLPIWVGAFEANAIASELDKSAPPRPMTHDLLRNLTRGLGATVTRVVVSDLRGDTFFATIWMEQAGETVTIDARPSDAIALALRSDCPIYISTAVLQRTKSGTGDSEPNVNADELRKWLENLNEDDTGQYKM